jgi:glyoxylase-like metal-dependent hydrolase (beta-lactamase superfamily II)
MITIRTFAFNMFQVNSLVLSDETGECIIIDPGCYDSSEKQKLKNYIENNGLSPVMLINTHCHVDHILGNNFVFEQYGLKPMIHKVEMVLLTSAGEFSSMLNLPDPKSPLPEKFLADNEIIRFGKSELKVIFTPGHSPGHISLYSELNRFIICGDVLFEGSIGRSDLPGGDHLQLIKSIKTRILTLGDEIKVYSGHGNTTTTGRERKTNPFLIY